MLKLADWMSLTYYMLKEEGPSNHIILVVDRTGKKAAFKLEEGHEIMNELSAEDTLKATRMLSDCKDDFLDYWNEHKTKS